MKTVTFIPQVWIGDYACQADNEGPNTWEVEAEKLEGIEPDDYESDELRDHPNAPQWVKDWSGPFYVTWETD